MQRSNFLPSLFTSLLLAGIALPGCGSDPAPDKTFPGTIKQESALDLAGAQACDANTSCPDGLECLFVAAFNSDNAICVEGAAVCEALDCGQGECLILESYPGQVMCSGPTPPSDDDDCVVSSDGTTSCPDDRDDSTDNDSGSGSEPGSGDPGQS